MALFESTLALLIIAVLLLQVSRRLGTPYPSMLALAGACAAALPWVPELDIDPSLALVLFIAPALVDAAFDTSPHELRRNWVPLLALVVIAVILTTAAVAWAGVKFGGLTLAAAIALGAIVAPPDAAAASAVLSQFKLPRRAITVLQGESLLNDAVALLIYSAALTAVTSGHASLIDSAPFLLAAPGGLLAGWLMARIHMLLSPLVAGTLSASIVEFAATFASWIVAEHLHISPIITVVTFAMTIAQHAPILQSARDRIHSYSVWGAAVFVLNVFAFLLMGMQARRILAGLQGAALNDALRFAAIVLAVVILVRLAWMLLYCVFFRWRRPPSVPLPTFRVTTLVGWCGMRGLVTLATAFALPLNFPGRDKIVLSAFAVVLGTLVVQGLTMKPLIWLLRIAPDNSLNEEISKVRTALIDAALSTLQGHHSDAAAAVRTEYDMARERASNRRKPQANTEHDRLRMEAIAAQRKLLAQFRSEGRINQDAFERLQEELDWSELSAAPARHFELLGT